MIYGITCFVLRMLFRILFRYKGYGLENIPKTGSFIMACNHVSYLDPLAIGSFVSRRLNYIAKKELFKNRCFGWYLRKIRVIPVDRESSPYSGMKEVINKIREGIPIVIFPEGTRGDGDAFLEPEIGTAYLALKFDLPVLPVYVKGTGKALPKDVRFIRREPVSVYYGMPRKYRMPAEVGKDEAYKDVSHKIMEEIGKLKNKAGD